MAQTVFIEAINQAIAEEMRRDESVFIMGEDIRLAVYGATANLLGEFGEKRVVFRGGCWGLACGHATGRGDADQLHVGRHGPAH